MLDTSIKLASAGSLSVAVIAFFFFIFQAWIYLKGPAFKWSRWGAALSLATTIYSVAVFVQFNAAPGRISHIAELFQYSTFIILLHCVYGFTFTYLDIRPPRYLRIAAGFHAALLVTLWTTKLVITDDFVYREFMLLAAPYVGGPGYTRCPGYPGGGHDSIFDGVWFFGVFGFRHVHNPEKIHGTL
jgi:hypothetical protein